MKTEYKLKKIQVFLNVKSISLIKEKDLFRTLNVENFFVVVRINKRFKNWSSVGSKVYQKQLFFFEQIILSIKKGKNLLEQYW